MASTRLRLLPILVFMWFPITFVVTFIMAVLLDHVNPAFPYISDSGTYSPESCIFGQLINVGSMLFGVVVYVRYRQIKELFRNHNLPTRVQTLNEISFFLGILSAVGVSFVGNFQETNVLIVHLIAASIGFGCGCLYLIIQTIISFKLFPLSGKRWILHVRVALSILCVLNYLLCSVFASLAYREYKWKDMSRMTKWSRADGGWEFHVVSAVNEWLTALSAMFFILTFSPEFRTISLSEPMIFIDEELDDPGGQTPEAVA